MRTIEGTGVPWSDVHARFDHLLPRDPRTDPRCRLVQKCGPPRLDEADRKRWPLRLARCYRSAVAEWFGPCNHVHGRRGAHSAAYDKKPSACDGRFCDVGDRLDASMVGREVLKTLEGAAERLHAEKLPPIAWAAFSCHAWTKYGPKINGRRYRPNVAWVYNLGRVERRGRPKDSEHGGEDWFDWHDGNFAAARVEMLSEHRVVFAAWGRLCSKLGCEPGASEERARELVTRYYAADMVERMVERIERARRKVEEEWNDKAKRDLWLWSRE